jgi:hypothetical protein
MARWWSSKAARWSSEAERWSLAWRLWGAGGRPGNWMIPLRAVRRGLQRGRGPRPLPPRRHRSSSAGGAGQTPAPPRADRPDRRKTAGGPAAGAIVPLARRGSRSPIPGVGRQRPTVGCSRPHRRSPAPLRGTVGRRGRARRAWAWDPPDRWAPRRPHGRPPRDERATTSSRCRRQGQACRPAVRQAAGRPCPAPAGGPVLAVGSAWERRLPGPRQPSLRCRAGRDRTEAAGARRHLAQTPWGPTETVATSGPAGDRVDPAARRPTPPERGGVRGERPPPPASSP